MNPLAIAAITFVLLVAAVEAHSGEELTPVPESAGTHDPLERPSPRPAIPISALATTALAALAFAAGTVWWMLRTHPAGRTALR